MLKLVFELIESRFVQFLDNLENEQNSFEGFLIAIPNPLMFLAIKKFGEGRLPSGCKFIEKGDDEHVFESTSTFLITNDVQPETILRRKITITEFSAFLQPIQRCILQILAHLKAEHFIDVFDASVVVTLKSILQKDGVFHLLRAVVHIIKLSKEGSALEPAKEFERNFRKSIAESETEKDKEKDFSTLFEFLDNLSKLQEPHTYIKAYLSYYVYLKSNKNISKASKILKISRTTLHDHLRIAIELNISDDLSAHEECFSSSKSSRSISNSKETLAQRPKSKYEPIDFGL